MEHRRNEENGQKNKRNQESQKSKIGDVSSKLNKNGNNRDKTTRNIYTIGCRNDQLHHDNKKTLNPCISFMTTKKQITPNMSEIYINEDSVSAFLTNCFGIVN